MILGECKVRPSQKEIDRFVKIARVALAETGFDESVLVFAANDYPPEIEAHLREKGILYFWSYDF